MSINYPLKQIPEDSWRGVIDSDVEKLAELSNHLPSGEERTKKALQLLKNLNKLLATADENSFEFLSYLLRLAILEAQAIASGSSGESVSAPRDISSNYSEGG